MEKRDPQPIYRLRNRPSVSVIRMLLSLWRNTCFDQCKERFGYKNNYVLKYGGSCQCAKVLYQTVNDCPVKSKL
jgi:hypothetical protein